MVKAIDKHIVWLMDAIIKIETYCLGLDKASFLADGKTLDACLMQCIVIGESIKSIRSTYPGSAKLIPSNQILGLRNLIAHNYHAVDGELIRDIITQKIPILKQAIQDI